MRIIDAMGISEDAANPQNTFHLEHLRVPPLNDVDVTSLTNPQDL